MLVLRMTVLGAISLIGTITSRHPVIRLLGSYMRVNNYSLTIPAARVFPPGFISYILIQIILTWLNSLTLLLLFFLSSRILNFAF